MFVPFGKIASDLGRKLLRETIVLYTKTIVPILSIQPFSHDNYEHSVKVKTMNVADHNDLQRMAGHQTRKCNACRRCLKCESLCKSGAISITSFSLNLMQDILQSTDESSTDRARILVGAYGKGKSHIVLTILSVLMRKDWSLFTRLAERVAQNPELDRQVKNYYEIKSQPLNVA